MMILVLNIQLEILQFKMIQLEKLQFTIIQLEKLPGRNVSK